MGFKLYADTEAGTKLEARPGLVALLADAQAHKFDADSSGGGQ